MNINQQFTYPTFKAKGTPIGGKGHAFERQLRTFTVPKDDLKKIHTIAEECGIMHEMFYRNKSIISKIGNLFGNNVFTKGTKERTYFLNSILNNFRLSIKVPTPQAKNKYNELFVFGIGKKEENDDILRFCVKGDGSGKILTTGVKFDNEAPQTIKKLKKESDNATNLDNILNTIKEIYSYCSSFYCKKQDIHIEPDKLKEIVSGMKTIRSIYKQHLKSWGSNSKLIFLRENPDIKFDTDKKLYTDKNNENYSYYFNTLDGKNTKDFVKLIVYDSQNNSAQTFVIKSNGEIFSPKGEYVTQHNIFDDKHITLTSDENIKKYDIENICNDINDYINRYSTYLENKHNRTLNKTRKKYTRRIKNNTQNIQLDSSDAETIINNIGKLIGHLNTKTYVQRTSIKKNFYKDFPIENHKKGIIYGRVPNTENYYSCNISSKDPTSKFIINVYDNKYNISKSFIVDKNGKSYIMHDVKCRKFTGDNLTLMSDEEIRTNHLEELCKDIKTKSENYLNYIDSNNINCLTIVRKSKDAKPAEKAPQKISDYKKVKPKTTVGAKRTVQSDYAPKTITEIPITWVSNTQLYETITQIFNTDVDKRSDKIIKVFGSNGKVIPAIFEYKTSDGESTIRIMKAITNWGIMKTNYCIKVANGNNTYYYRIDCDCHNKIIKCNALGQVQIFGGKIQHITHDDYQKKYPFMAKHFPEYVKEISELLE